MHRFSPTTPAVRVALLRACDDRATVETKMSAVRDALNMCVTLQDVRFIVEAVTERFVSPESAIRSMTHSFFTQSVMLRLPSQLTTEIEAYLLDQVRVLDTHLDASGARWEAGRRLDAASDLGLWSYHDAIGRALRTSVVRFWQATAGGDATPSQVLRTRLYIDQSAARLETAVRLARLCTLDVVALEDLADGCHTWAAGTEACFARQAVSLCPDFLIPLCRGHGPADGLLAGLLDLEELPSFTPGRLRALEARLRSHANHGVDKLWRRVAAKLFHHPSDAPARVAAFALATTYDPDLAIRWIAKAPLHILAAVPHSALEPLLTSPRGDIRQATFAHMDRVLRARPRLSPVGSGKQASCGPR